MRRREKLTNAALASLAVAMVLTAGVGSADAYFTTYAEARGGYGVELGDRTEIWEGFSEWTKKIVITSTVESEPVWIRVRAFAGSDYTLTYTYNNGMAIPVYTQDAVIPAETVWYTLGDGFYYYNGILDQEHLQTGELDIKIGGVPAKPEDKEAEYAPEDFDVIVIYESTPVRYHEDGSAYADWTQILDSNLNNPEKDPVTFGGAVSPSEDGGNEEGAGNQDNGGEGGEG